MRNLLIFILVFFSSCYFNKALQHPTKLSSQTKDVSIEGFKKESLLVHLGTEKITFTEKKDNPLYPNYSIDNIFIKSASGNQINGWYIFPMKAYGISSGETETDMGILFLHDGFGNITDHFTKAMQLVKHGFAVLIIDYSGYGLSNGKATEKNACLDASSAFKWLNRRYPSYQFHKLAIYGEGFGGQLAAYATADNMDCVNELIIEDGYAYRDMTKYKYGILGRLFTKDYYSATKILKKIPVAKLIIHSTDDSIVPYALGQNLYKASTQPKMFYQIGGPHNEGLSYYADSISSRIRKWSWWFWEPS